VALIASPGPVLLSGQLPSTIEEIEAYIAENR
jgi:hypothetical protein